MAETGADKLRVWALTFDGLNDYQFGEVPGPYGDHDSDPRDGDCSGACYAWWRWGGVPASVLGGRNTADFYYRRGEAISSGNAVCGDYIVLRQSNGIAHHIIMCIGRGDTMEAKGEHFGYVRSTVAKCMTRGRAKAMRMPKVHNYLGNLTGATGGSPRPAHPVWPGIYFHLGLRDQGQPGSISRFQGRLKVRGWKIDATGVFDEHTRHVVMQFQEQKHLEIDGVVGPQTWNALWELPR
jgi:peptidoglycan hydrolase-like protein with peptidoglycan-binding domain